MSHIKEMKSCRPLNKPNAFLYPFYLSRRLLEMYCDGERNSVLDKTAKCRHLSFNC